MRQAFEEREMEETEVGHERELTLGSAGLLIVILGLLCICGVCFAIGYSVGHRGSTETATSSPQPTLGVADAQQPTSAAKQKPSAAPQPVAASTAPDPLAAAAPPSADPDGDIVTPPASAAAGQQPAATSASQFAVRPALPSQALQSSASAASSVYPVAPAIASSQPAAQGSVPPIMVQIAAVSHVEDADVLVNALRRRGYAVSAHRDLADSLIHIRVGPFFNRADANNMKLKLLNDGYNAIVDP